MGQRVASSFLRLGGDMALGNLAGNVNDERCRKPSGISRARLMIRRFSRVRCAAPS